MTEDRSGPGEDYQVRSEARGGHWVAWIADPGNGKPIGSVVVVGRTREEAEERARAQAAPAGTDRTTPAP